MSVIVIGSEVEASDFPIFRPMGRYVQFLNKIADKIEISMFDCCE